MRHYFAYAVNMDEAAMAARCPTAHRVGRAVLPGHAFAITGNGLGTVIHRPGGRVHGVVWRIARRDEQVLDEFEGLAHRQYRKAHVRVRLWEGGWLGCMAYQASVADRGRPLPGYLDAVVAAAENQKLPERYIEELRWWGLGGAGPPQTRRGLGY